jgi:integrase
LLGNRLFSSFLPRPCSTLTGEDLANWRGGEKEKGKKDSSINREANAFLAMLRWGRENDKIINCPLIKKKIKKLPESDSTEIIRYLSVDERQRLLAALDKREKPRQPDYLRTLVLVALNTGIRRGALLKLTWDDLSFETQTIRLRRETAKSDKLSYIPMNSTVYDTLTKWKTFKEKKGRVEEFLFTGSQGTPLSDIRKSWATVLNEAKITGFRWHDLRHDYASQLVMAGVSILTVKELLTHTNLEQTLRYAHLAPDQKKSAVDKLDSLYK